MNNASFHTGRAMAAAGALMLLSACQDTGLFRAQSITQFAPCTASGSVFDAKEFDDWDDTYHAKVSEVVSAHIDTMSDFSQSKLVCSADEYMSVIPPSEALRSMAEELPAWKDPRMLDGLSEADAASVLLEFLRVYECSMNERAVYLSTTLIGREENPVTNFVDLAKEQLEEREVINRELDIARPALHRTLGIIGGFDRLGPLSVDVECVKRASLDLRNVLGLAAEASACMPKAWDPHGSLRDLKE